MTASSASTSVATRLPPAFCWTRFGSEAGQSIDEILLRKERERVANGGVFLWGIGNSISSGIQQLVLSVSRPEVLFSPIKGRARLVDREPPFVVCWRAAETMEGEPFELPPGTLVTSRGGPRRAHYALVCFSDIPLCRSESGPSLGFDGLRNLLSGRPLGASQVTAVVNRNGREGDGRQYTVPFRATLVSPYFVRLRSPLPVHDGSAPLEQIDRLHRSMQYYSAHADSSNSSRVLGLERNQPKPTRRACLG
jgi:hypothetical protein